MSNAQVIKIQVRISTGPKTFVCITVKINITIIKTQRYL